MDGSLLCFDLIVISQQILRVTIEFVFTEPFSAKLLQLENLAQTRLHFATRIKFYEQRFLRLKEGFSIQFFVLRQRPRTSLQCFALEHSLYKAKHYRDILGRCLRTKNQIQNRSFSTQIFEIIVQFCLFLTQEA